jgi:hypothetical protein
MLVTKKQTKDRSFYSFKRIKQKKGTLKEPRKQVMWEDDGD